MMELDLKIAKLIEQGLWGTTKDNYIESLDPISFFLVDLLENIIGRARYPDYLNWD
jgi:hypothetical protein